MFLQVLIEGSGNPPPYAVIDVGQGSSQTPVAKDFAFDLLKQHMYVLTNNRVTKVPIQSCKVYRNCAECVTTLDPLGCGWCGNHCTTQSECLTATWKKDSCPPSIYKFEPKSGPIEGGTRVTITGHNFGSNNRASENVQVNVQVALVDCVIEYHNGSHVVCHTGSATREMEREIKLVVVDRSKQSEPYIIEGSDSTDHESFFYKKARMLSFKPEVGPRSGGTSLTIQGENLDIGSNLDVHLGHLPCSTISVKSSHIVCNTSRWQAEYNYQMRHKRSEGRTETVNVTIDAASLFVNNKFFSYEEDPEIESVSPRDSILSGGLRITVKGKNLHVIQEPKIIGRVVGDNTVSQPAPCQAYGSGEVMVCNSPNVNVTAVEVTEEKLLGVDVSFFMDGVEALRQFPKTHPLLSRFTYVMDPVFYKFGGPTHLRTFYDDETHLDIKGASLDQIDLKSDIVVTIGDSFCNVTLIGTTILLCSPERPAEFLDDEPLRPVEVTVGNLRFEVGNMQFSKREPNVVVAGLLIGGLSLLLIIVLAFVCILLKKSHKGPFKKKMNRPDIPVMYSQGDRVTIGHLSDQQLYRLPTTENPYSSGMQAGRLRHRNPIQIPRRPGDSLILDEESRHLIEDANLLIDREKILLLEIIGQGHFGCVYRGFMKSDTNKEDIEVAVKTLKSLTDHNMYTSSHEGRKFLEEALRMREFDHPNIVRLIGIALDKEDMPLVVLPFMKHGDLLTYIRDEHNNPTVKDLMDFGIEIAQGMEYLSNLKFVHRDLAARNCMLDDNMTVKVADFGLSRDIYERDYYSSDDRKAKLPVKWMALESLEKGIYNIKTDVWSFGVVLWELMTRGVCPYPEVDNWDIIKFLKSGRRMPQPSYCPDQLYAIMLQCWEEHARLRPSFAELVKAVKSIIVHMEKAHQRVGLNVTYINVPTTQTYLYPQTASETDSSGTIYRVMSTTPTGIPAISNVLYSPGSDTGAGVPYYPHPDAETDVAIGPASGYSSGYDTGSSGMYRTLPDRGGPLHEPVPYHGNSEHLSYAGSTNEPLLAPHYAHPRGSKATLV